MLAAYNGDTYTVSSIPVEKIENTLGAGDRAHADFLNATILGKDPQEALLHAVLGAASVIQVAGAHGDLYPFKR